MHNRALLTAIAPPGDYSLHKGQAGRIGIIGGCEEYTGAPYYAAMASLRAGCELVHVFCDRQAAPVIKSYSPDLIVHPYLQCAGGNVSGTSSSEQIMESIWGWLDRLHVLIVGPGLGRDPLIQETVARLLRRIASQADTLKLEQIIIDADGLWLLKQDPSLVQQLPAKRLVLTPNLMEFRRLCDAVGISDDTTTVDKRDALRRLCENLGGPLIVLKGVKDLVVDGEAAEIAEVLEAGSVKRSGGQGDILCGLISCLLCWLYQVEWGVFGKSSQKQLKQLLPVEEERRLRVVELCCRLMRQIAYATWQDKRFSLVASDILSQIGPIFNACID